MSECLLSYTHQDYAPSLSLVTYSLLAPPPVSLYLYPVTWWLGWASNHGNHGNHGDHKVSTYSNCNSYHIYRWFVPYFNLGHDNIVVTVSTLVQAINIISYPNCHAPSPRGVTLTCSCRVYVHGWDRNMSLQSQTLSLLWELDGSYDSQGYRK